ncbi:rCG44489, partial [Rattus norvegicus]
MMDCSGNLSNIRNNSFHLEDGFWIFSETLKNSQLSCMKFHLQWIKLKQDLDFEQMLVHVLKLLIFY